MTHKEAAERLLREVGFGLEMKHDHMAMVRQVAQAYLDLGARLAQSENWELVERWCEHYPNGWRLLFKRPGGEMLEVEVPEDVWRAFDRVV